MLLATVAVAVLTLVGCTSGDGPSGDTTLLSSADNNPGAVSVGNVTDDGGNVVAQASKTVNDLGTAIGTAPIPVISDTAMQKNLDATITSASNTVQTLDGGVNNGLGKIGLTPDPIGTTVQSSDDTIRSTGITVGNAGQTVSDLDAAGSPLAPSNPMTSSMDSGVSTLGQMMQGAGGLIAIGTSNSPVQQITQQTSNAIVPLSSQLVDGTQAVDSATMLDGPLADALNTVGDSLQSAGAQVGAAGGNPLMRDVGDAIGATGGTVASADGLINGDSGDLANPLAPITGALSGGLGGGSSPLAPVTGTLSDGGNNPLAPVTGALTGAAGSGNPLASITNVLDGITNTTGSSGSSPLSPLTDALSTH